MEIPDLTAIDRTYTTDKVLSELIRGDFEAALQPAAFTRIHDGLETLRSQIETSGRTEGTFVVRFSGSHHDIPASYGFIPEWLAIQYKYGLDEEGELEFGPDIFETRSSHITEPEMRQLDETVTYNFSWSDINWDGGFAIAFGQMPDELLHRN